MLVLNLFDSDLFSLASLTEAINKLPFVPSRIGEMGLFQQTPIATTTAIIEEQSGLLAVLPWGRRGGPGTKHKTGKRTGKAMVVPHIGYDDEVLAESVQNVRAFGSETQAQTIAQIVNEHLAAMRQNHEVTHEYHRANAIQGLVKDSDGRVEYNLWEFFGITQPTDVDFVFGTSTTNIQSKVLGIKRTIEAALGGAAVYDHIHCLCGPTFFDAFTGHTVVRAAYDRFRESEFFRSDVRKGFDFCGVVFEEYIGTVSGQTFIPAASARFFPVGVPGLFQTVLAPADYIETVNTLGQPVYAKQEPMKFNKGIEIESQSNPLMICTRPGVLVRGHSST